MINDVTEQQAAERRLEESERFLALSQRMARVGSWRYDVMAGRYTSISDEIYRLYGLERPAEEPVPAFFVERAHPDDRPAWRAAIERAVQDGTPYELDYRIVLPDGTIRWIHGRAEATLDSEGRPVELIGTSLDITERKDNEHAIEEARNRLRVIIEQLPAVIWTTDRDLRIASVAGKATAELHLTEEMAVGATLQELADRHGWPSEEGRVLAAHEIALRGETAPYQIVEGSVILRGHAEPLRDASGAIVGVIGVALDVTAEVEAERRLKHLAHHDALTGLPNRIELERVLQRRLAEIDGANEELAVIFIDLDGFAYINDTFGHTCGDEILIAVAERLRSRLDSDDVLCRWGGDEFVIVHRCRRGPEEVSKRVEFILEALDQSFLIGGYAYNIDATAGISIAPRDGTSQDVLLRAADAAMYRAKEQARGSHLFFAQELHAAAHRRLMIERALRAGLARNELSVVYQPIWDAALSRVVAVEALLRWDSAELGAVDPDELIPVAEEAGLIRSIGAFVLREACRQGKAWQDAGLGAVRICVNLSPKQLRYKHFAYRVRSILEETGFDPRLLELELTERVVLDAEPRTASALDELRRLGVRFSIDDFGTGYCSLRYLKTMRVHSVKIDRFFVKDLPGDAFGLAIAQSIVSLGHSLGLTVVAEGIEREDQCDLLRSIGCDELQGYLLSEPLSATECTKLIAGNSA